MSTKPRHEIIENRLNELRVPSMPTSLSHFLEDIYSHDDDLAAKKIYRLFQWQSVSHRLIGSINIPANEVAKLQATFLDQGFSEKFHAEVTAALKAYGQPAGPGSYINYAQRRTQFWQLIKKLKSQHPNAQLSEWDLLELEADFIANSDVDEASLEKIFREKLKLNM